MEEPSELILLLLVKDNLEVVTEEAVEVSEVAVVVSAVVVEETVEVSEAVEVSVVVAEVSVAEVVLVVEFNWMIMIKLLRKVVSLPSKDKDKSYDDFLFKKTQNIVTYISILM